MIPYDFSNHQNRFIALNDMPADYLASIERLAQNDPWYPAWHIAPPCGLLNDPCGLFEKHGVHHIFHQWFPAGPVHGLKYWRLLTTRDFISYRDYGPALAPELPCDDHGCFTGSAFTRADSDDVTLYYTGISGAGMEPSICSAEFAHEHAFDRHVVIERNPHMSTTNFRDTSVFERDDTRYMIVGAQSPDERGQILLYRKGARDGFEALGPIELAVDSPDIETLGYMIECPNYFETDKCGVMFFAPMGIKGNDPERYRNVFSVVYAVGAPLEIAGHAVFHAPTLREFDYGFDFYAPQSYRDETGRRILIGWLGNSKSAYPTDPRQWAHMLTAPRELTVVGDRIVQHPIREITELRGPALLFDGNAAPQEEIHLPVGESCAFDIVARVDKEFAISIKNDAGNHIVFSGTDGMYQLDRTNMSSLYATRFGTVRRAPRLEQEGPLRILIDRSSIEIFADGGRTVFTSRYFIDRPACITLRGMQGTCYPLAPITIDRVRPYQNQ